jgi:hypothetical protein
MLGYSLAPLYNIILCNLWAMLSIKVALGWTSSKPPKIEDLLFKVQSSKVQSLNKDQLFHISIKIVIRDIA